MPRSNLNFPIGPAEDPVLASLLGYWEEKRGVGAMPARAAIDPLEMGPRLLPHLLLSDLLDRGTRVRFRLVGTTIVKRLGFDPTGRFLGDVLGGGYGEQLARLHRLLCGERVPLQATSIFHWGMRRRLEARHLLLPLSQGGSDPAIALVGIVFASAEAFPPHLPSLDAAASHGTIGRAAIPAEGQGWRREVGRKIA